MSSHVDLIALTLANCRFVDRDAVFEVITFKELGSWNACVIRTAKGHRKPFLNAADPSIETAVSKLHDKSGMIAKHHIHLYGYALDQRSDKKRSSTASSDQENLSDSSQTIDVLDRSESSGYESLSDDETLSIASGAGGKRAKKGRQSHKRKEDGNGGSD
ncbi:hypothetical protein NKR19_g10340, partial [Coniochaeta hoffmannii]